MGAVSAPPSKPSRLVPLIIGCALFMQTLDSTIVANALPTMARDMRVDPISLNIVITAYLVSTAVFLPISAWLADRYGARRVFISAIALFALSSLLCGISQSLPQLVGARLVQGAAGAMLMPVGRLLLLKSTPREDLVRAMAVLTMPAMLGPVIGPVVGGFIVTYSDWRWIFFINLPIGLVGALLVNAYVPNIREDARTPLDIVGFILSAFGFAGLIYGLENVARGDIPRPLAAGLLLGGVLCLFLFARHARRTPAPILDLTILRIPSFSASLIGGGFARLMIGAAPFLLALLLQLGFGYSALQAGLITFVSAAGALLMKTAAPPILARFGFRRVLIANAFISAALFAAIAAFRPETPHALILIILFVGGFFRSLQFTALNTLAFAEIKTGRMSRASSLSSMFQQLALSIGVGVAAILVDLLQSAANAPTLTVATVAPAFFIVAVLSLASVFFFARLPAAVGDDIAGHRTRANTLPQPPDE